VAPKEKICFTGADREPLVQLKFQTTGEKKMSLFENLNHKKGTTLGERREVKSKKEKSEWTAKKVVRGTQRDRSKIHRD